jgi:hypothetical protein
MLPESLVTNGITLAKLSDNTPQGTVYKYGSGLEAVTIAIRSNTPAAPGASGTVRRLVQVSYPATSGGTLTADSGRVTVNMTITHPSSAADSDVGVAAAILSGALDGTTTSVVLSDFLTKIIAGHN